MSQHLSSPQGHTPMDRRRFALMALASAASVPTLIACSPKATAFKSTDVTGASFAQDLRLKDHHGQGWQACHQAGRPVHPGPLDRLKPPPVAQIAAPVVG